LINTEQKQTKQQACTTGEPRPVYLVRKPAAQPNSRIRKYATDAGGLNNGRRCFMNPQDLTGPDLDPYISKALGHVGKSEIAYHASGETAMRLYAQNGESLQRYADGFYATMRHGAGLFTQQAKDPITAIYRAYILSRLGDEL
jgi:hypothetical protein